MRFFCRADFIVQSVMDSGARCLVVSIGTDESDGGIVLRRYLVPDNSAVKTARYLVYLDRATDM